MLCNLAPCYICTWLNWQTYVYALTYVIHILSLSNKPLKCVILHFKHNNFFGQTELTVKPMLLHSLGSVVSYCNEQFYITEK